MYPVEMGFTAKEKVKVVEKEVNTLSILYSVEFHTFKEEIRIYYPNNISPVECQEKYSGKIGWLVNRTLRDKDPKYFIERDKNKFKDMFKNFGKNVKLPKQE
jgi:hypothetical protein